MGTNANKLFDYQFLKIIFQYPVATFSFNSSGANQI